MNFFQKLTLKSAAISALLIHPFSAFAGSTGTVTFVPLDPTAVPTLSTSMLIVLSVLLMVIAFRVSKQKNSSKFFMTLIGASVLMASTGGVKLVSDLQASATTTVTIPEGQTVDIFGDQFNFIENTSGVSQRITDIDLPESCENYRNGINFVSSPSCNEQDILASGNGVEGAVCNIDCRLIIDGIDVIDDDSGIAKPAK